MSKFVKFFNSYDKGIVFCEFFELYKWVLKAFDWLVASCFVYYIHYGICIIIALETTNSNEFYSHPPIIDIWLSNFVQ